MRLLIESHSSLTSQLLVLQCKHIDVNLLLLYHLHRILKNFVRIDHALLIYSVGVAIKPVFIILRVLL